MCRQCTKELPTVTFDNICRKQHNKGYWTSGRPCVVSFSSPANQSPPSPARCAGRTSWWRRCSSSCACSRFWAGDDAAGSSRHSRKEGRKEGRKAGRQEGRKEHGEEVSDWKFEGGYSQSILKRTLHSKAFEESNYPDSRVLSVFLSGQNRRKCQGLHFSPRVALQPTV